MGLKMNKVTVVLLVIFLSACTNTTSTLVKNEGVDGLTYFMPNKDFIVTITMTEPDGKVPSKVSDVVFSTTSAYADRSKQYVIQHGVNWLNDNKLAVTVSESGLLKTSTSTSKTKVTEVFEGIATTAGYGVLKQTEPSCNNGGNYVFIYQPDIKPPVNCGVTIDISQLPKTTDTIKSHSKKPDSSYSGVFYRQEEAYKIKATTADGSINKEAIIYSPSGSEVLFLPISRSLFGDSEATLTFKDGMPTGYIQDDKSEIVGALAIPAKVIGAYFNAVGELFSAFSTKNTNESALIKSESELEIEKRNSQRDLELLKIESDYKFKLAELKAQACKSAVDDKNQDLVDSIGCSK